MKSTVLFVEFGKIGGPPARLSEIVAFATKQHSEDVECIVFAAQNSVHLINSPCTVYQTKRATDEQQTKSLFHSILDYILVVLHIAFLVVKHNVTTIYCNHYQWVRYTTPIAFLFQKKLIVHLRDIWPLQNKFDRIMLRAYTNTSYICISKYVANVFSQKYRVASEKIQLIYDGISVHDQIAQLPMQARKVRTDICMFSRIETSRNIEIFIDTAFLMKEQSNMRFFHYGYTSRDGDLEYYTALKKRVKVLGLEKHVSFLPYSSDRQFILQKMRDATAVLVTADEFALPNTAIEAILCGTPVIAYDAGGNPEVITDGVNGYLVKVNTAGTYAAKLTALLNNPAMAKGLEKKIVEKTKKRFYQDRQNQKIVQTFT